MKEEWKNIKGYEGLYQVSNLGNVKSFYKNEHLLKLCKNPRGYLIVILSNQGITKTRTVHRLVAEAFITNQENKPQVNHIDGNKLNNRIDNLEWCTGSENVKHSWNNGLEKVTNRMREHCKEIFNKKIYQYSKQGELMKEWESASQAGRELNIFQQAIVNNLKGRSKTAGGFVWKYRKE